MITKNVTVKVNQWDNESDGKLFDLSHLDTEYNLALECDGTESVEMLEDMAMDIVTETTGWCILDCNITIV